MQLARGAAQVLGQRAGCGTRVVGGRSELEQADVILAQQALAVVPFRQRDALAVDDVVLGRRGQVEVEAHLGGDALAVTGDGELLQICRRIRGVVVGVVVRAALDLDELSYRQQALGAKGDDHPVLLGRVLLALDAVGLLAAVPAGLAVAGLGSLGAAAHAGESAVPGATEIAQPQQHGLGGLGLGRKRWETADAARSMQGLAQQPFACSLRRLKLVEPRPLGNHGLDQAAVARLDAGPALQCAQRGALVLAQLAGGGGVEGVGRQGRKRSVGGGIGVRIARGMAGGERCEPKVEIAVEAALGQGVDLGRQAQRGDVHATAGDALVGAGDTLQQAAAGAMGIGGRRSHAQPRIAAEGAEEDAGDLLDLLEPDRRLREMPARGAGDQAVPEQANVFFHSQ